MLQQVHQRLPDVERRAWRDLSPYDRAARLRVMVRRVVIHSDKVEIVVGDPRRRADGRMMQAALEDDDDQSVTVRVPIRIKSWGGEKAILTPDGTEAIGRSQPDMALIKAAVRAHHWQELLEQGEVCSVAELAAGLGHHPSYVGSLLGCAFLAPDIVDALLAGRQPRRLTLGGLMAGKFPLSWSAQRQALGFHVKS